MYSLRETLSASFAYYTPPQPGLLLSAAPQFLERGKFAPGTIKSAYFSPDYYTTLGLHERD